VTASFGITAFGARDPDDEIHLLRRADRALYEAKQTGRNRVCLAR
jgi:PleD family two-component response regulator